MGTFTKNLILVVITVLLSSLSAVIVSGWTRRSDKVENSAPKSYVDESVKIEKTERIKADEEIKTDVKEKDMKTNEKIDFIYRETYKKAMGTYPKD